MNARFGQRSGMFGYPLAILATNEMSVMGVKEAIKLKSAPKPIITIVDGKATTFVNGVPYTLHETMDGKEVWEGGRIGGTISSTVMGEPGHPGYYWGSDISDVATFEKSAKSAQNHNRMSYESMCELVREYEQALTKIGKTLEEHIRDCKRDHPFSDF